MLKQIHCFIKGDVIGVGFRAWTKIQARNLGIGGWVRNVYDEPDIFGVNGGVEAVFQGQEKDVDKLLDIVKQGPPVSRVDEVDIITQRVNEIFEEFEILK